MIRREIGNFCASPVALSEMWEAFEQLRKAHEYEERCVVTTNQVAALVQINASIEHFLKGE
jgi:hypothetical protein